MHHKVDEDDIFVDVSCERGGPIDHAVLLVAYGVNKNGKYWLVRNFWGTDWGRKGFGKISRDKENYCNISWAGFIPYFE